MNDLPESPMHALDALTEPGLAPLFWRPSRLGVASAWYGHVPFAHWVVAAHRPSGIVELGAHNGVSYAAFCEAVLREQIDASCIAVDTWEGDKHAGFYGDDVYQDLRRFHDERYGGFSILLRASFDAALDKVLDGSVDLLHIDGRHTLDDATHDFTTWERKLSRRAVVLFHDTNVREHDFGVWQLWARLRGDYPSFEFLHGHGLGVLAYGPEVGGAVASLCRLQDGRDVNAVRERFAILGERWIAARDLVEQKAAADKTSADLAATRTWAETAQAELNKIFPLYSELVAAARTTRSALAVARHDVAMHERAADAAKTARHETEAALRASEAREAALRALLEQAHSFTESLTRAARDQIEALIAERQTILKSTSWRLTAPLRRLRAAPAAPSVTYDLPVPPPLTPPPSHLPVSPAPAAAIAPAPQNQPGLLFISGEDHTPGNVYRVERYVAAAQALGFSARWMPAAPVGPADLENLHAAILWRVPHGQHVQGIIDFCRDRGTLVVFDVDDLMFRPELAVIDIIDGIRSQKFSELHTKAFFTLIGRTLQAADVVTCPTAELAHEARLLGRPACVMPNGFDQAAHDLARRARQSWAEAGDDLLRIGYAAGSRTHQRDFAVAAPAIARVLKDIPQARLVVFRDPSSGEGLLHMNEFPHFDGLADRIEWRDMVKLADLPTEIARFAVNVAPLEADNPFCEAKSELKYFEAALAGVPTIASPSGPYRRAIRHGVTGFLAATEQDWHDALTRLLTEPGLRARIAQAAYHDSLAHYGPEAQAQALGLMLDQVSAGTRGAAAFERALYRAGLPRVAPPEVPESEVLWRSGTPGRAAVTVIIPVHNYADFVGEALESVAAQTLACLDLVVVDDASPDDSSEMVLHWLRGRAGRFGSTLLLRHRANAGLGFARNSGFAAAETDFILPLDADNRLHPAACETLLAALRPTRAAFAYPAIRQFGDKSAVFGTARFSVLALQQGNYIDAMALVRKSAWAAAGGYDNIRYGWEDYDFWCRLVERGAFGISVPQVLADYRVHPNSMLHTLTEKQDHRPHLVKELVRRHPWLDLPG